MTLTKIKFVEYTWYPGFNSIKINAVHLGMDSIMHNHSGNGRRFQARHFRSSTTTVTK